jgi:hypothetical protein
MTFPGTYADVVDTTPIVVPPGKSTQQDGDRLESSGGVWVRVRAQPRNIVPVVDNGDTALASIGTSGVHVAGSLYIAEVNIAVSKRCTGVGVLNGATVGTDNMLVAIYDEAGNLLANSALAGVLSAGANSYQQVAFLTPVMLPAGRYFVAVQFNGTTATTRKITNAATLFTALPAGAFGTVPATITVPSAFTTLQGIHGYVY